MAIDKIGMFSKQLEAIKKPSEINADKGAKSSGGINFGEVLTDAIKEVDGLQRSADQQIESMVIGKDGVTTHDAMIALEKADIAFQLMNQVRGRIIRAYEEVMRTQI